MPAEANPSNPAAMMVDVAIVGGGIAGLWTAWQLEQHGYTVALFEAQALGSGQTLAAQGIIHGGVKYSLAGQLSESTTELADMPERWRSFFAKHPSLEQSAVAAEACYLFAATGLASVSAVMATKGLNAQAKRAEQDRPAALAALRGQVYALDEMVVDTAAVVGWFAEHLQAPLFQLALDAHNCQRHESGFQIQLSDIQVHARELVCCAGAGNRSLVTSLDNHTWQTQLRPLKQVMVPAPHQQALFAHCMTGAPATEPRITVTTHKDRSGNLLWYLGGKLATSGVERSDEDQLAFAVEELNACFGWYDWHDVPMQVYAWDRAESGAQGHKPATPFAERDNHLTLCFPTKLAFAPRVADEVMALLPPPANTPATSITSNHPRAGVGQPLWF